MWLPIPEVAQAVSVDALTHKTALMAEVARYE